MTYLRSPLLAAGLPLAAELRARYMDADPDKDPLTWTEEGRVRTGCHAAGR